MSLPKCDQAFSSLISSFQFAPTWVTKTRKGKDWTAPVFLRFCEGTGIIFEYKNSRAGVANTYVEFDPELGEGEKLYLVICDHTNSERVAYKTDF